jgi:hypothetical protein
LSLSRGRERERRREGKKERLFEEIRKREKEKIGNTKGNSLSIFIHCDSQIILSIILLDNKNRRW